MNQRILLPLFIFFVFVLNICGAQELSSSFRRVQDSVEAMYRIQSLTTHNKKPFYILGNAISTSNSEKKPGNFIGNITATTCFDTSQRSFIVNDTTFFYTRDPFPSADGNYFISGQYVSTSAIYTTGGFLAKTDHKGNVLWHRTYRWQNPAGYSFINYYRILELQDGSVFLAGVTGNPVTGNNDIIFTKTDMQGNITWSKVYKSRFWTNGSGSVDYYYVQQMKQDPASGDIYLTGPTWTDRTMMRINSVNGNIAWANAYDGDGFFDNPFGLVIKSDRILMFSRVFTYNYNTTIINLTELDKATGDTIACRYWKAQDTAGYKLDFLGNDPLTVLDNGHYVLAGKSNGNYVYPPGSTDYYQASVVEFDSNLNFIKAYNFKNNIESNSYNSRVSVYRDGSVFFTMMRYISGFTADVYSIQVRNGQIAKQRMKHTQVGIPYEPAAIKAPDGGDLIMRLVGDTTDGINKIELLNLHVSDTASACLGVSDNSTFLYPFTVGPIWSYTSTILSNVFEETTNRTIISANITDTYLPGCMQVSHCDSIKVLASATVLCPSQTLQLTGRKNLGCGSNIFWQYNTAGIASSASPNDSTLLLTFSGAWSGYIYGSIGGCSIITDSVYITVLSTPATLNLGPDFTICPQNTRLLNAHTGYVSYYWQDGSTDSTFLVTQPGTYYVATTDACGVTLHDTVYVSAHAPVLVSLGPDRSKCNNDTIILQAPPGFITYNWSPNYNINALNMQVAVVNPAVDTSYIIRVEAEPGCYGFDTVKIAVLHSPPITLGNDTSFCKGASVTLFAGAGFAGYQWSTGSLTGQITVNQAGFYSVIGTTSQGCKSYDTLQVLQVYNNPVVMLNHDDKLCLGTSKILDAGAYTDYRWQNGAVTRTITVNSTGVYYVDVTDNHGCKGSDTSRINTILPLPKKFLPDDLSKCAYEKIIVKPKQLYDSYVWSNTSTAANITVVNPGLYWLDATDQNHCTGRDSIIITQLQCLKGLFVPNAFTPNADGYNDELKASLFGEIKKFKFIIYNRYGQAIFSTSNVNMGWNGVYKGMKQEQGTYVWKCQYQLEGEDLKEEGGSFILLK